MWNSQHYLNRGRELQRPQALLLEAIRQSKRLANRKPTALPVLLTLCHLARRVGVPYADLRAHVARRTPNAYRRFRIRKRSGGIRNIVVPEPKLALTQSWIAEHILGNAEVHPASHAFQKGCSILKCAESHAGARWLVKIDIADFFGSINEIDVSRVFRHLGYNPLVSFELARLCTDVPYRSKKYALPSWRVHTERKGIPEYTHKYLGRLPQGAPSSPMLANLTMLDADQSIQGIAEKYGLVYTRYSDDMTFSTQGDLGRENAHSLVHEVCAVLKKRGLFANRKKTRVIHPGARRVVLGLLVDGEAPRLPRSFRDKLRQHLYYLESAGIESHMSKRQFESAGGLYRHLRGLLDYAHSIDPVYAAPLLQRLEALPWRQLSAS